MFRTVFPALLLLSLPATATDPIADLQREAVQTDVAKFVHWGTDPKKYTQWRSHSNRLIPVYTFGTQGGVDGVDLISYSGENSPYRTEVGVKKLYGQLPKRTVNPAATWLDQTNVADIQRAGAAAGKKYIFLVVFDGMDWQTTRAAAIYNAQQVTYSSGRGSGTHFQNYNAAGTSQFGFMVTSPHNNGTSKDVNEQTVGNPGGTISGGYDASAGGTTPWDVPADLGYLIGKPAEENIKHAHTDSASSATSMTCGVKTYNGSINVAPNGEQVASVAHELQDAGWSVGAVSSVPVSHATPACAYAHNVTRSDYQDISRDLLGLPSVAHPDSPLPGMDVLLGGGHGHRSDSGKSQGENYEPGNIYLADSDLEKVSIDNGGRYVVAVRTEGQVGDDLLTAATQQATRNKHRLLGFFGVGEYNGHLPYQTADGDFRPVPGNDRKAETYTEADIQENPTLSQMTSAALQVLASREQPFWLMVESGDVDWANHDNNLDNSIGAVNSGDAAIKAITDWVEQHSNWNDALLIATADHGHLLNLVDPAVLITK